MNTNFTLCPIRAAYTMRFCVVQTLGPQNAWNAMRRRVFWIQPAQIMDRAQSSYTLSKETKKGLGRHRCRAIWSPTAPQEFRSVGALKKRTWSLYGRRCSQLRLHRDLLESFEAFLHFCSGKTTLFILILFVSWMPICAFKIFRRMNIITNIEVCASTIFPDLKASNLTLSSPLHVSDDLR